MKHISMITTTIIVHNLNFFILIKKKTITIIATNYCAELNLNFFDFGRTIISSKVFEFAISLG
jgi:hypothetical protein